MGAALPIAALAVTAGGQLFQGFSERKAENRAAAQDDENARLSLKAGEQDAMDVLRQGLSETDAAAATMAGSGLAWGGSIAAVLADSAHQVEMDIQRVREKAVGEANNYTAQAREHRRAGKAALLGGMFNALSTAIGGAADIRNANRLAAQGASERAVRIGGGGGGGSSRPPLINTKSAGSSLVDPRLYGRRPDPMLKY
jgi:hypothetical protein